MRISMRCVTFALTILAFAGWGAQMHAQTGPKAEGVNAPAAVVPVEVQKKAKTYKGSAVPPKNLKKLEDGHWTPYTPPSSILKGAEVYTIVKGDTLSNIAQEKLGTWLLWPQIWDLNPYIKDAHWIYPGDPLYIRKPQLVSGGESLTPTPKKQKPIKGLINIEEEAALPPVTAHDIYCSGFIRKHWTPPHLTIISGPTRSREALAEGDLVYLNEGSAEGIQNGDQFTILKQGQKVSHPQSGRKLGRFIQRVGRAKILAVQEHTSIAKITQSCDEVTYGMKLIPWKVIPIPWSIKASKKLPFYIPWNSNETYGRVVWTEDRLESVGQHNLIYVTLGSQNQILPGDKLLIFRFPAREGTLVESTRDLFRQQKINVGEKDLFRPKKVGDIDVDKDRNTAAVADNAPLPKDAITGDVPGWIYYGDKGTADTIRKFVGEAVVLTTERKTACAKILLSSSEIHLGDWVQIESK